MAKTERKMPVRTKRVELAGDYVGWWLDARINVPFEKFLERLEALAAADEKDYRQMLDGIYGVLELLVVSWNFVDDDGNPVPVSRKGFKSLPYDLLYTSCEKAQGVIVQVPLAQSAG